jgi:integrase
MASIWKRANSQYWTACFRDQNGNQRRASTKETNRKQAQKIADEYEKAIRTKRTLRQTQKVLDRLHEEISGEKIVRTTLRKFVADWLETKEPETAPQTYIFYKSSVTKLIAFLGARADLLITEITRSDLLAYRNSLAKKLAARSVNHDVKVAKMLFRAARKLGLIAEDPAEFVDCVRRQTPATKRPFTLPQLRAILDVADPEWRSLILFGLYTGQRLGDLAKLRWANVDLQKGEVRLKTAKTGRIMIIPMAEPLRKHAESLPISDDPHAPIHPRAYGLMETQGKSGGLSNQFADLLADAGLREKKPHRSEGKTRSSRREINSLSFHSLRRTATTLLHEAGIPAAVAQALIGHDSEAMHELYINVGRQALEKAAAALPAVI